jgi:hypothetical protein
VQSGKRTKFDEHAEQCPICSVAVKEVCPEGLQLLLEYWYELEQEKLKEDERRGRNMGEELKPKCDYDHEHCHTICHECYGKAREHGVHLYTVDWVSGSHRCCYCGDSNAVRWVRPIERKQS